MDKDSPALNARQQLFCDAVLDGCTQAEAYRRAGYQSQQPASGASVLMRRPEVAAYLQQQRRVLEAATPFTRQRALEVLRDIAEDLDRGRQYVPQDDLRRFGVDLSDRRVTPAFVELMRFEIARCRELYASADLGVGMLPPQSARCIEAARVLYGRILDKIEAQHYDVFAKRATVSTAEKAAMVARLVRPRRA
mgnify:CR=1 FL=1